MLSARLFGGLHLTCDGIPPPPISNATVRSLLAYLLTYRDRSHTRDLLAGTFWPDLPDDLARRRLSQALWLIRKSLGPHFQLDTESAGVRLAPDMPLALDIADFERLAACPATNENALAAWLAAVGLCRGDFLAGYYEDWVLFERERLRERLLELLGQLTNALKARGDYERALTIARRLVAEDSWREAAHREVMRLLHLLNRDAEALRQAELCCHILETELHVQPEAETLALAREIARRMGAPAEPYLPQTLRPPIRTAGGAALPSQMPLIGRREERAALLAHLEAAIGGAGTLIWVEGEAGVGKTRLLQEVARDAAWRDIAVLWGRAREDVGLAPFDIWVTALRHELSPLRVEQWSQLVAPIWLQVLRPLLPELAAVAPESAPALEPERERERLINAFAELLGAWSATRPLVLILEGLHWAGGDSLEVLAALDRRLTAHRVAIIGSYRRDEAEARPYVWERLQALHRPGQHEWVQLSSLDAAASGELIRRSLAISHAAPLFESRVYQETGGNPLFMLEILRALADEGLLLRDSAGQWSTPWDQTTAAYAELPLPPAVEQVIARRLAQLEPAERAVLETAAVIGNDFDLRLLQVACEQNAPQLLPTLRALVRRHFLIERPSAYEFSHDQVRQVTYRTLSHEAQRATHQRVARAIAEVHPENLTALALHLDRGELWERAVDIYFAAGKRAAAVYANEAALQAYARALAILEQAHPLPAPAETALGFELRVARCPLWRLRGERESYRTDIETLLSLAETLATPEHQVEALLQRAEYLSESTSEYEAAREAAAAALALAQEHGFRHQISRAWLAIGTAWKQIGHNAPALEAYQHALAEFQNSPAAGSSEIAIYVSLVMTYRDLGDLERAQETAQTALAKAPTGADPLSTARVHNALAWITRARGDHRAEAAHCREMLTQMRAIGHRYYEGVALNNLGLAYNALGEHGPAIETTRQALEIFRQIGHQHGQVITLLNLSSRYKNTGQLALARQALNTVLPLARQLALADDEARILSSLAELLTNTGDFEGAERALCQAETIVRELDAALMQATVHYRFGELYLARGDYAGALMRFEEALHAYERSGYPYYQTTSRAALAIAHFHLGEVNVAQTLIVQAFAEMESRPDTPPMLDVCFYYYRILDAARKPELARAALERACAELQQSCAALSDPSWQRAFVEDVPLHRQLMTAWKAFQPRRLTLRLPRAAAPTGRALRPEETVSVTWTVEHPDDQTIANKTSRRQRCLLRLLAEATAQGASPRDEDLAAALGVGLRTLRRDIAALRAEGHEIHTRGR
ncbi:MAG: AAA family ATPase [Anaerolineae bacterium]|nr:AAA family ATPase [Anaerolineae bacterium]